MKIIIIKNYDDDLLSTVIVNDDEVEDAIIQIEEVAQNITISVDDPDTLEDTITYFREQDKDEN